MTKAFSQGSRGESGTGLGLYHVKQMVDALGGSVGYQDNIQAGFVCMMLALTIALALVPALALEHIRLVYSTGTTRA